MKYLKNLLPVLSLLLLSYFSNAQQPHVCGLHHEQTIHLLHKNFLDNTEAKNVVHWIMNFTGLPANFSIQAGDVPNAAAVIILVEEKPQRIIVYNTAFIQSVKMETTTDWGLVSILAHEIGHHLSGHTLGIEGSNHQQELEADEFSGFVLFKMGASLRAAQAAIRKMVANESSETHPGKVQRLAAIAKGWHNAKNQLTTSQKNTPLAKKNSSKNKLQPADIFSNIYTEQDANTNQLNIFAEVNSSAFDKKGNIVAAWFYEGTTPLKDTNQEYATESSYVATFTTIQPKSKYSTPQRVTLKIPTEELHLSHGKIHELNVVLGVVGNGNSMSYHSQPIKFFIKK